MMKTARLATLWGGLLVAAAAGTASAATVAPDFYAPADYRMILARHGADDLGCDDHGSDLCASAGDKMAKRGADDTQPDDRGGQPEGCDDHGTDLCATPGNMMARHGADDRQPDDRGGRGGRHSDSTIES